MNCEEAIKIYRGDDTNWNGETLLHFKVTSPSVDLSAMTAEFILGSIVKSNIPLDEGGEFDVNYSHTETASLPWGLNKGVLKIFDSDKRIKTVSNSILFFVTSEVVGEQGETIIVPVPETSPVEITLTIGGGSGGGGSWGSITGNIQDQEDLQAEFSTKMDKSGGTFTGDVTLAQGVSLKTQVGELHDINDNIVLGGKGTNYGLYVAPDGTAAALVGNNSLKDIITTEDVKSTYSASGTDPVNGVAVASALSPINAVIPNQATAENQLADKNFVNSSVATNTANFIGTFNSVADLEEYSGTLTNNDYAFVISTDSAGNTVYNRYKYTTATAPASWQFEYALNNSSFTSNQWAAINSGATSTNIAQIATNTTAIAGKQDTISDLETIRSGAALGATSVQPATLANYATTTDLAAKQDKTLTTPITVDGTQETTVEGALGAINTLAGKGLRNKCRDTENSLFVSPNQTDEIGTAGSTLNSVYFGPQAQTTLGTGTTVVGSNGVTQYNYGTSVGSGAKANQGYCTAIGSKAKASGGRNAQYGGSTALGSDANANGGTALGSGTNASSTSVAVGRGYDSTNVVTASGNRSIAIGALSGTSIQCKATGVDSIQLGKGVNSTAQLFQVYSYPLLDGNTGKIPVDRLPDGIGVSADGETIIQNQDDTISTVAVKEQNADVAIKQWVGTKAEYDLVSPKDPDTIYVVTDDNAGGITQIDGFNANAPVQRLSNLYGVQKWQTQELWYSNFSNYSTLSITQTLPSTITSIDVIFEIKTSVSTHVQNLFLFYTSGTYGNGIFWEKSTQSGHAGQLGYWDGSVVSYFNTYVTSTPSTTWFRIVGDNSSQTLYTLTDNNYTIETLPEISQWTNLGSMHETFASQGLAFSSEAGNYFNQDGILKNYYVKANGNLFFDLRTGEGLTLINSNNQTYKPAFDIRREYHWN